MAMKVSLRKVVGRDPGLALIQQSSEISALIS